MVDLRTVTRQVAAVQKIRRTATGSQCVHK